MFETVELPYVLSLFIILFLLFLFFFLFSLILSSSIFQLLIFFFFLSVSIPPSFFFSFSFSCLFLLQFHSFNRIVFFFCYCYLLETFCTVIKLHIFHSFILVSLFNLASSQLPFSISLSVISSVAPLRSRKRNLLLKAKVNDLCHVCVISRRYEYEEWNQCNRIVLFHSSQWRLKTEDLEKTFYRYFLF